MSFGMVSSSWRNEEERFIRRQGRPHVNWHFTEFMRALYGVCEINHPIICPLGSSDLERLAGTDLFTLIFLGKSYVQTFLER